MWVYIGALVLIGVAITSWLYIMITLFVRIIRRLKEESKNR
jgi:hypothetical protein